MERKQLKVTVQKKINNYLFNAYYLCIILANENMNPWFYENYIQLYFNPNKPMNYSNVKEVWLDFYGGWTEPRKILDCHHYDRLFFDNINIIKFIETSIDNDNYVYTYYDEYYIKSKHAQKNTNLIYNILVSCYCKINKINTHTIHDIFIYGYDKIKKVFLVIGFDEKKQFCTYNIDYSIFEKAFYSGLKRTMNIKKSNIDETNSFHYMEIAFDKSSYEFRLHIFLNNLHDYLNSYDSSQREDNKDDPFFSLYQLEGTTFGVNIYNEIIKYVHNIEQNEEELDYRVFHTLYEHKKSILERVEYVSKICNIYEGNTLEKLQEIAKAFDVLRMLVIKYNLTKSKVIISKIPSIILQQKEIEIQVLKQFYDKLYILVDDCRCLKNKC